MLVRKANVLRTESLSARREALRTSRIPRATSSQSHAARSTNRKHNGREDLPYRSKKFPARVALVSVAGIRLDGYDFFLYGTAAAIPLPVRSVRNVIE